MNDKRRKKKLWLTAVILGVTAVCLLSVGVGNYLVNYAIGRAGDGGNRQVALKVEEKTEGIEAVIRENREKAAALNQVFLAEEPGEIVTVRSEDGLTLSGGFYAAEEENHLWAITIHGYRGNHEGMITFVRSYLEKGFSVVAPDLRACGESEGNYVGMGWPDRRDILQWIRWILEQDPEAQIVIHGISMGAATTMMTAGEDTPDAVRVFVEDCGYTSVWDVFASELGLRFHLPAFPVLYTASAIARVKAGYDFKHASSMNAVASCEKPMLFIHGTLDDFIPYEMLDQVYDAKVNGPKAKVSIEGAGHGEAMYAEPDTYWNSVWDFVDDYVNLP